MKIKPKKRKLTKAQRSHSPASKIKQLQSYIDSQNAKENNRIQAILDKPFKLSMECVFEETKNKLFAFHEEHGLQVAEVDKDNLGGGVFVPESVTIDAYNQGDLIIALKMQQVDCNDWLVGVDTHLYNYDTEEVVTVPFQAKLEGLSYIEMMSEAPVGIMRESGFKTRWKGIEDELNDHYKNYKDHDLTGFTIIQTQMKFAGECYFKNYKLYQEYLFMRGLRDKGELIPFLENMTQDMVNSGQLNDQLQPMNNTQTAISVDALKPLIEEAQKPKNKLAKLIQAA